MACASANFALGAEWLAEKLRLGATVRSMPRPNALFESLGGATKARLNPYCETVPLTKGDVLCESGDVLRHAYFPLDGLIVLLAVTDDGRGLGVATVGTDGMVGVSLALNGHISPKYPNRCPNGRLRPSRASPDIRSRVPTLRRSPRHLARLCRSRITANGALGCLSPLSFARSTRISVAVAKL